MAGLRWAGLVATVAAALPVVLRLGDEGASARWIAALVAFSVFAVAFWLASTPGCGLAITRGLLGLQLAAATVAGYAAPGTATFVVFVVLAAQLPAQLSPRAAWLWMAGQTLLIAGAFRAAPVGFLLTLVGIYVGFQLFAFYTASLAERERRARLELAAANATLLSTQSLLADRIRRSERDRLAADLHDVLGHNLVALKLNLEAVRHHADGARAEPLERAREMAGRLLEDVRSLVRGERARADIDLAAAVRQLASEVPRPEIAVEIADDLAIEDPSVADAVLRCLREALTNAIKHSGAQHLYVRMDKSGGDLRVSARDDGAGASCVEAGVGLTEMSERARRLGGAFEFGPAPEGGFRVELLLPLRGAG